jgi:hypothetical protein
MPAFPGGKIVAAMIRVSRIILGYVAAVASAVTLAVALFFVIEREASGALILIAALYAGAVITAISALPGFLATLAVAARRGWRSWWFFGVAGAVNALCADAVLKLWHGAPVIALPEFLMSCVPGGLIGGLAYWAVAGRFPAKAGYEVAARAAITP